MMNLFDFVKVFVIGGATALVIVGALSLLLKSIWCTCICGFDLESIGGILLITFTAFIFCAVVYYAVHIDLWLLWHDFEEPALNKMQAVVCSKFVA